MYKESEGVPLREWQPRTILRPMPPPYAAGAFPPETLGYGEPLQFWFNEGWWECVTVPVPPLSKKQEADRKKEAKEAKKKQAAEGGKKQAAGAASSADADADAADGKPKVCVRFLHYEEIHWWGWVLAFIGAFACLLGCEAYKLYVKIQMAKREQEIAESTRHLSGAGETEMVPPTSALATKGAPMDMATQL